MPAAAGSDFFAPTPTACRSDCVASVPHTELDCACMLLAGTGNIMPRLHALFAGVPKDYRGSFTHTIEHVYAYYDIMGIRVVCLP